MIAKIRRVGKRTSRTSGCASADIRLSRTIEPRRKHDCWTGSCRFLQVSVIGREGARDHGLQVVGRALQRPGGWDLAVDQEVRTGDEITALIADDGGVSSPIGVGNAADGDEQPRCRY